MVTKITNVFEGRYSEETMYEDLIDDIFIVLTDSIIPECPMGLKVGKFTVKIDWECK
jgi:hypothetical protein